VLQQIHLTLEVFDTATGRTELTMPVVAIAFNPQLPVRRIRGAKLPD
jgi:hypothetical protein